MAERYEANWQSLDQRPLPEWFDEAKFGIFIHWGVYSVPAWAPRRSEVDSTSAAYAEHYGGAMRNKQGRTWAFHRQVYGEEFSYRDFAPSFKAELFDPAYWAEVFKRAGAKYVVLTSKHHDGYCLWPSRHSNGWNSVDVGPKKDLVGMVKEAVTGQGLKMGLYYSLLEWFNPLYKEDPARYAREHMLPQLRDLVERYEPELIFADGEWDHPSETWGSCDFLEWLYNESTVRESVVVNDRWGKETRSRHGGYYTTEYGEVGGGKELGAKKWEENRSLGASFGYNRNERLEDYLSRDEVIHLLVDVVSRGGNLLLNVGPTADGRIPVIFVERLLQIGEWLQQNGEAIYGSRPWRVAKEGDSIRYTAKDGNVYVICEHRVTDELVLRAPKAVGPVSASLVGGPPIPCRVLDGAIVLEVNRHDAVLNRGLPVTFKLSGVE